MKYCKYCSGAVDENANFCPNCGASVVYETGSEETKKTTSSNASTISSTSQSASENSSSNSSSSGGTGLLGTLFGIGVVGHLLGSIFRPRPPMHGPRPPMGGRRPPMGGPRGPRGRR